eukprot:COSAG01_NODE_318_length_18932_cov_26.063983_12_plen_307_part_00
MQAELELPSVASAAAAERMAKDAELARQLHGFDVGRSQRARTRTQHFVAQDATADNQEVQALVAADLSRQVGRAAKDPKLSRSAKPYHTGNKDKRRKVAEETNTTQVKGALRAWTDAEVTQLIELVKRDGNDGDWAAKASLLGTGRTASACYSRYYKYTRTRTKAVLPEQQEHGPLLETAKEGASTIAPQRRAVRVAAIRSYNENSMADEAFARAEDAQDCGTTEAAEWRNQRSSPKQPKSRQAAAVSDKAGKKKGDSVLSCCMMPMCNLVGTKQICMLPCTHLFSALDNRGNKYDASQRRFAGVD